MTSVPLLQLHRQAGATIETIDDWELPALYSSVSEEYSAATQRVGLADRSHAGRLRATGRDALDLLNRLSTNNLEGLADGQGIGTVLTSNKGRIIDLLYVFRTADGLLILTSPQARQRVMAWIDFYTFAEDVGLEDVTGQTAMLSLLGPSAAGLLAAVTGQAISSMSRYGIASASIGSSSALVVRTDFAGLPGYEVVVPASDARHVWEALLDAGKDAGIRPVGSEALDIVRVEQGIPVYGRELGEEYNPLEAGLLEFISFNKGCYVGQEVVARLNTYKKVQKHLVRLTLDAQGVPPPGTPLLSEGKRVGVVTSAATLPVSGKRVGLGYVRTAHAIAGARLTTADGGCSAAIEDTTTRVRPDR